jgi:hypothetical protein
MRDNEQLRAMVSRRKKTLRMKGILRVETVSFEDMTLRPF